MTFLDQLHQAGALEPLDLQLGRLLERTARERLGTESAALLGAAAARVSADRRRGNACIPVEHLAALPVLDAEEEPGVVRMPVAAVPSVGEWRALLTAAGAV